MSSVKNLHVLFPEKFFFDYIPFVNNNFNPSDHLFLYTRKKGKEPIADNVKFIRFYRWGLLFYWELYRYANSSDKIILHSLSKNKVIWFLFLFKKFRKKSYWCLWGGDLYYRTEEYSKPFYNPLSYFIFKNVVKDLGGIVTHVQGDVKLASKWFGFHGKHIDCFLYPSNLFKPMNLKSKTEETIFIQIGNSAHRSNNHIDAIDSISYLANDNVSILCPLSYGDDKNAQRVIQHGKKVFGDKFIPLTDFMPFEKYIEFLSKIDIAIFNHWRQQGLGNIITLLGLGKTVYLRDDITTWSMLMDKGIHVRSFNTSSRIEKLSEQEALRNISKIKEYFSLKMLIQQSAEVFS